MPDYTALPAWAKNLYTQTRARAKRRQTPFTLSPTAYAELFSDRCALSGIPFDTGLTTARNQRRAFAPSLDRIDNGKGYEAGNVRLVCVVVNIAMNIWGEDVLWKIARGLALGDRAKWRQVKGVKCLPGVKAVYVTVDGQIRYKARIRTGGKERNLGIFSDQREAHQAFKAARATLKVPPACPSGDNPKT